MKICKNCKYSTKAKWPETEKMLNCSKGREVDEFLKDVNNKCCKDITDKVMAVNEYFVGTLIVGENFGCIHFEKEKTNE